MGLEEAFCMFEIVFASGLVPTFQRKTYRPSKIHLAIVAKPARRYLLLVDEENIERWSRFQKLKCGTKSGWACTDNHNIIAIHAFFSSAY